MSVSVKVSCTKIDLDLRDSLWPFELNKKQEVSSHPYKLADVPFYSWTKIPGEKKKVNSAHLMFSWLYKDRREFQSKGLLKTNLISPVYSLYHHIKLA